MVKNIYIKNLLNSIQTTEDFFKILPIVHNKYQESLTKKYKKNNGIYYTHYKLAYFFVSEFLSLKAYNKNDYNEKTILEPCVGIGEFIFAYLSYLRDNSYLDSTNIEHIIQNIFVADIDKNALEIYKELLKVFCKVTLGYEIPGSYFNSHITEGLLFELDSPDIQYKNPKEIFNIDDGFDFIFTNPPYKNLKADSKDFDTAEELTKQKIIYNELSKYVKNHFSFANEGVLNLYKIFVEEILQSYSKSNADILLIIPTSILNDKSCNKLRTLIFERNTVKIINCISESNGYFDGTQGLCSIAINKGYTTKAIKYTPNFALNKENASTIVNFDKILKLFESNCILVLNEHELSILSSLKKHKTLKDFAFISNLRGELDLTINKRFYSHEITPYPLLRGRNIGVYNLKLNNEEELFVSENFVEKSNKNKFIHMPRISCQQVVNINKERRLSFAYVKPGYVLGNSCNFISVNENDEGITLFYLLGLFNSSLMNWLFKIRSSNNHVNNYEIDEFPIPTKPSNIIDSIANLAEKITIETNEEIKNEYLNEIDELVNELFDINFSVSKKEKKKNDKFTKQFKVDLETLLNTKIPNSLINALLNSKNDEEIKLILSEYYPEDKFIIQSLRHLVEKYKKKSKGIILNHTTFKLSDLDLEMIKCVPPGGNWKNIKPEIIKKSKRLIRITETGGRTTLYGRIRYDEPCYTITTYFNRPGNGTYVHPVHDRVLSVREAARIQSFDDDYYFVGNKTDYLKQIGNAVPPLLAYEIGKQFKNKLSINTSIDLFVGAGGLTSGIKRAGIQSVIGVDFEEKACLTLKVNNPEIDVICGDLTKQETKDKIYQRANDKKIDMICGGPPCQGFSLAGFRNPDDPRNNLFLEYVDVLKHFMPKVFIMENVEGMKSMEGGKIYSTICKTFESLGYEVEGRFLFAHQYGVPQKRKRLITIGIRKDLGMPVSELFPLPLNTKVTAYDALHDLESVECSENATFEEESEQNEYLTILNKKA